MKLSDRDLFSVLWYQLSAPPGEEAMLIGLRMFEIFGFGAKKWAVPDKGNVDIESYSDEPHDYDLTPGDVAALRAILSRPGQPANMWITAARALRRIQEAAEPKALSSVP